jgi:hypothetical protein
MLFMLLFGALLRAAAAAGPDDPPFDLTRVLFSAVFSGGMVLQRAPQTASVFGTATPGAFVTVRLSGPNNFSFTCAPVAVASASDLSLHGTWKTLLPAVSAGFGYNASATCDGCTNASAPSALLVDVGFGDVFLCSGQVRGLPCPPHR